MDLILGLPMRQLLSRFRDPYIIHLNIALSWWFPLILVLKKPCFKWLPAFPIELLAPAAIVDLLAAGALLTSPF